MAAAAESADLQLDACAALRADLAARSLGAGPAAQGSAPNGRSTPGGDEAAAASSSAPEDAERAAAWLPLVVGIERAARLPGRERPAHFRRQRAAWDAAAEVLKEGRYAVIGGRLARWRAPDPRLPLVKELLWALEQPEAVGYTRLALAGMTALGKLVPADAVRAGYVLAQSARAVRTLGNLQGAVERYTLSGKIGRRHRNQWLCTRSATGLGTTYMYFGNYPAARAVYHRVLERKSPDACLTAIARHGLLVSAMAAQDWDAALAQGWHLLQAEKSGALSRTDILNLMASLCHRIGRYRAAVRAAEGALRLAIRPDHVVACLAVLVDVAAATHDQDLGRRYGPVLRQHVGGSAGPFEDARALLALAGLEHMHGAKEAALADLASARVIADRLRYHELQFEIEKLCAILSRSPDTDGEKMKARSATCVPLSEPSQYIVSRLDNWSEHDDAGVVTATC